MPVINLSAQNSLIHQFITELRDIDIQADRMRFRKNLERLGEIFAYEISKTLSYGELEVETPMGIANSKIIAVQPVLATILRAGIPMHQGLLNFYDQSDNAFVTTYRRQHKDGTFEIHMDYVSCPILDDRPLIICDPMVATGMSMTTAIEGILQHGTPSHIHIVTAIASTDGIEHLERTLPKATIWAAAIDEELTARSYIVPGLGDAGDLAYGDKNIDS
ncbi:uracil phosphoribosyltransferase [Aureispira anguillae]|uniref:Uracil phosphoribosyltransferase n=1 Tax=Aureispira anguillae TaxID=2864201 RepID=A0A915YGW6_9BACT|nr:uracil phosphoribosyltransferase [Aureispira anguillae]BDS12863.1 uracil phosphoribosyltransferase [Aureispira anguillae]